MSPLPGGNGSIWRGAPRWICRRRDGVAVGIIQIGGVRITVIIGRIVVAGITPSIRRPPEPNSNRPTIGVIAVPVRPVAAVPSSIPAAAIKAPAIIASAIIATVIVAAIVVATIVAVAIATRPVETAAIAAAVPVAVPA